MKKKVVVKRARQKKKEDQGEVKKKRIYRAKKTGERVICEVVGSAFIEEIGGENSSLFELSSLPLLLRDFHDDWLRKVFGAIGSCAMAFGANFCGQLGVGDKKQRNKPKIIPSLSGLKIIQICSGEYHSMAILESGEILSWGDNSNGQLGLGDEKKRYVPNQIKSLQGERVVEIHCGFSHNFAITENGIVYSWGWNYYGQLGFDDNSIANVKEPKVNPTFEGKKVPKIFCGSYHSFFVLGNEVLCCGWNVNGQLGIDDNNNNNNQITKTPKKIASLIGKNIISIACGNTHTLALTENGEVLFCGNKIFQPFDFGGNTQISFQMVKKLSGMRINSISCGEYHCLVLQDNHDLYIWGRNDYYVQLGLGYKGNVYEPVKLMALDGNHIESIFCGGFHSFAINESKEIFVWGDNSCGQLGLGDNKVRLLPEQVTFVEKKEVIQICCGRFSNTILVH